MMKKAFESPLSSREPTPNGFRTSWQGLEHEMLHQRFVPCFRRIQLFGRERKGDFLFNFNLILMARPTLPRY